MSSRAFSSSFTVGDPVDIGTAHRRQETAVQLLTKVLALGWCELPALAIDLAIDEDSLAAYASGEIAMPLESQLRLARLVIDRIPPLSRQASILSRQASAAIALNSLSADRYKFAAPGQTSLAPGAMGADSR